MFRCRKFDFPSALSSTTAKRRKKGTFVATGHCRDPTALIRAMIPRRPLVLRQGHLNLIGRSTAQPFHLSLPGGMVIKDTYFLPGPVTSAEDKMGMLVALITFGVRPMDSPHDGHVPALRKLVCQLGDDLHASSGWEGVRQRQDNLTSHTGIAAVLGPIKSGRELGSIAVDRVREADFDRASLAPVVELGAGVHIARRGGRDVRAGAGRRAARRAG